MDLPKTRTPTLLLAAAFLVASLATLPVTAGPEDDPLGAVNGLCNLSVCPDSSCTTVVVTACAEDCPDSSSYTIVVGGSRVPACAEAQCHYSEWWGDHVSDGVGVTVNGEPYCVEECGSHYDPYVDQDGFYLVMPGRTTNACYEAGCRYNLGWGGSTMSDGVGVTLNGDPYCVEECWDDRAGVLLQHGDGSTPACPNPDPFIGWIVPTVLSTIGMAQDMAEQAVDDATNGPPCEAGGIEAAGTCVGPVEPCDREEGNGFHLGFADVCTGDLSVESCSTGTPPPTLGLVVAGTPVCVPTPTVTPCTGGEVGVIVNGQRVCTPLPTVVPCESGKVGVIVNGQRTCVAEPTTGPCRTDEVGMVVNGVRACAPEPQDCSGAGEVGVEVGAQRVCQVPPAVSQCDPPRQGIVLGTVRVCL